MIVGLKVASIPRDMEPAIIVEFKSFYLVVIDVIDNFDEAAEIPKEQVPEFLNDGFLPVQEIKAAFENAMVLPLW